MRPRLSRLVLLLALALPLRPALAQSVWQAWLQNLNNAGYSITQGSVVLTSVSYCLNFVVPIFGTCFDSDASDPYIIPLVPVGSGYVDPYFGTFANYPLPNGTVTGQDFRLGPNDAVLLIVTMPPDAGYFSYQNYVFTRATSLYRNGHMSTLSPDPARGDLYATYGNSVNDTQILDQSGVGFGGGQIAIFATANSDVVADLTSRFSAVGGNPALLFPDPIGSNAVVGLDSGADDFSILFRYLVPASSSASETWLDQAAANVLVYRLSGPASLGNAPYAPQTLRNRGANTNESVYAADLTELATLLQGWIATQESKSQISIKQVPASMRASASGQPLGGNIGDVCITFGSLCNGDSQDTIYWSGYIGHIGPGGLFAAEGVNPAITNNTNVLSLNLEDTSTLSGLGAVSQINIANAGFDNGGVLDGSAVLALQTLGLWAQASPQLQQDAPNLYIHLFVRGCTASQTYCSDSFVTTIPTSTIPYPDNILFYQRSYALPGSEAGPNPYYVAAPYVIY